MFGQRCTGNIVSLDLSKLLKPIENASITVKKSKSSTRKKPTFHRKSYIKERTSTNDNKVEVAKKYDEGVATGAIEDVRVPKRERNDLTTDEVDK